MVLGLPSQAFADVGANDLPPGRQVVVIAAYVDRFPQVARLPVVAGLSGRAAVLCGHVHPGGFERLADDLGAVGAVFCEPLA